MTHKCYISFKTEDIAYKKAIQEDPAVDIIDRSLNDPVDSSNFEYIMRVIREDYLRDSTVTIFLIGEKSSEDLGWDEQKYIKRELQASLYNGSGNSRNGILGIVLPSVHSLLYKGQDTCVTCGGTHSVVKVDDATVIKEFSYNYYLPDPKRGCAWGEEDRYCVLVSWDDFKANPSKYIDEAFDKRSSDAAGKVRVRP